MGDDQILARLDLRLHLDLVFVGGEIVLDREPDADVAGAVEALFHDVGSADQLAVGLFLHREADDVLVGQDVVPRHGGGPDDIVVVVAGLQGVVARIVGGFAVPVQDGADDRVGIDVVGRREGRDVQRQHAGNRQKQCEQFFHGEMPPSLLLRFQFLSLSGYSYNQIGSRRGTDPCVFFVSARRAGKKARGGRLAAPGGGYSRLS